jgi:DNA-binding MarR family transcriptional regulator/predicted N-acetyltransferase YhbS
MHPADERIAAIRAFNRYYTKRVGALDQSLYDSPFTLTQVRVLYEIAQRERPVASDLVAALGLDAGYLSRLIAGFERQGLVARTPSSDDARRRELALTRKGAATFGALVASADRDAAALLGALAEDDQRRLVDAIATVRKGFGDAPGEPVTLREPRPGDLGWVVERHGALYASEYGYSAAFEALVARIAADWLDGHDPACERGFIAERGGARLGCVFVVKKSPHVAKLRMLLIEPAARGLGLGRRLVDECVAFARAAGYRRMVLWTHSQLDAARHIYERAGFVRVASAPNSDFGRELVDETWEMDL